MLCLTRRKQEKIHIGPDIVLTVIEIMPGKVRLGIDAPPGVDIWREEIRPTTKPEERP